MAAPTVFAQVLSLGHHETFHRCVTRYRGDECIKSFSCYDQWLAMASAQLTFRANLRDFVTSLRARQPLLYQMGFRGRVLRSTLAEANEHRDWRIFADWTQTLIRRARQLRGIQTCHYLCKHRPSIVHSGAGSAQNLRSGSRSKAYLLLRYSLFDRVIRSLNKT